ncbi:AI-2E family transporter [Brochothrix thermosphacta]|uniref:AI-2E family transporter n=1 Tax=Brochothrix thermosphacta TaxID=2756 RepID=UPI0003E8C28C|nr:AI-2E family transporter [Brochothrix thermosphacta]EUJ38894.1 hypothetical protein BTHER_00600 [Brochothrix thermosphacta DSM 20171 = FSL F6-1036]ODJ51420.1 hypothetical protein BFR34_01370 [Brochothrix thermosphacta DSM 20171 = FSL F6-1036]
MKQTQKTSFEEAFLNNRYVIGLIVSLLLILNIIGLTKISFIFHPLAVVIQTVFFPVLIAGAIYYVLNPVVKFLSHHKVKRWLATTIIFLLMIGIVVLLGFWIVPVVKEQILELIDDIPGYIKVLEDKLNELSSTGVLSRYKEQIDAATNNLGNLVSNNGLEWTKNFFAGSSSFFSALSTVVLTIVTIPLVLFYMLKDADKKLLPALIKPFPVKWRPMLSQMLRDMNDKVSHYVRGQLFVALVLAILFYIGYLIIGMPNSLTLAVLAGATSIVPYLGPIIAISPALILALITSPAMLIKLIIVWSCVQFLEGKFVTPQIMGRSLDAHPLTILFSILIAGHLLGVVGILLAIPGYSVLKVLVKYIYRLLHIETDLYNGDTMK